MFSLLLKDLISDFIFKNDIYIKLIKNLIFGEKKSGKISISQAITKVDSKLKVRHYPFIHYTCMQISSFSYS